ncbi:MAG: nodulation protein NfeD [Ktedonobacteraceae bacterium]|nr:nodulation protein NfeD [Ktedonobacteraceae bacterium]MBO0791408.1 nodulation protein NfeD [Ktedonobacteraceae bacterium]
MYAHDSRRQTQRRFLLLPGLLGILLLLFFYSVQTVRAASSTVDVMALNGEINQASLHTLTRAIASAQSDGARALVIEIDTPGGDIDSMKSMTQAELASNIPIISYVSPTGGRAASAGAFVTLAAPIAAMAPTTRIGASSPVDSSGNNIDSTLKSKIENDLTASITGIQNRYGRNVPLATAMVTDAKSYDDTTAGQAHLVDITGAGAVDLKTLLQTVDGRGVKLASGQTVTLQTAGAAVHQLEASPLDTFYGFLLDANIAFLLFIVAVVGIYLEISHPGIILPGVAGSIALLLFLFSVGSLSPNWAGMALMVLAFVLLVLDVKLPTHGVLTVGAVFSLAAGALIFFNSGSPFEGPRINPWLVTIASALVGLLGFTLVFFIVHAQRLRVTTGPEGMVGETVTALTPLQPAGRVRYGGENWAAVLEPPATFADVGTVLRITAVEGLCLHVQQLYTLTDEREPKQILD